MTEPALTQIDSTTGLNPPDRQSKRTTMLTVDKKRKMRKPPLRIFENFCQRTFGTYAKPHKPSQEKQNGISIVNEQIRKTKIKWTNSNPLIMQYF